MDKPEFKIRGKVTLQSVSHSDQDGNRLDVMYDRSWTIGQQDYTDHLRLEAIRPESTAAGYLKIERRFTQPEIELFLTAASRLVQLIRMRKHMQERAPEQNIEFSIDAFDDLKIGAIDYQDKEPSYFVELSKKADTLRIRFDTIKEFEVIRDVLKSAR